ncbi:MAG: DUF1587 domain-containing protein, partial [Planctomycetaceae bacterium]|nr:DUF1587 domain-containing protein [Planctomycetaceae bacterium]
MNPPSFIAQCLRLLLCGLIGMLVSQAADRPPQLDLVLQHHCMDCHASEETSGLNLNALSFELSDAGIRGRWINISDRVQAREMPPPDHPITETERQTLLQLLQAPLLAADRAEITATGRVPLRRLNREEYEQNLRDLLQLPELDLRDMLPEDREQDLFNKSAEVLEMSRVQLDAFLNAADVALQQAVGTNVPLKSTLYRAIGRDLFAETSTFGEREAMFFAKDNLAV